MARIVAAMYAFGGRKTSLGYLFPPFYEGILSELRKNGNDVLVYANADRFGYQFEEDIPKKILNELKIFNPDLFILFSNQFWDVSKYFDCPILVYGVDSPFIYSNKTALRNNKDRFLYLVSQASEKAEIIDCFKADGRQIRYMPFVSAIRNRESDKLRNIVFCGSIWLWEGCQPIVKYMKASPTEQDILFNQAFHDELLKNPLVDQEVLFNKVMEKSGYAPKVRLEVDNREIYAARWSGSHRMKHLQAIADLGLEIYGNHWAQNSMAYFPDLALRWNSKSITGIQEWERLLNSSYIGFNVSHLQAREGFSWRVVDTMASGACLVTNWSENLDALFGKDKIPAYRSPYEAREICQKLLRNENMRKDIVAFCNERIDEKFRPIHALELLEDFTKVSLVDGPCQEGEYRVKMLDLGNPQSTPTMRTVFSTRQTTVFRDSLIGRFKARYRDTGPYKALKCIYRFFFKFQPDNICVPQVSSVQWPTKEQASVLQTVDSLPKDLRWMSVPFGESNSMEMMVKCTSYQELNKTILSQLREKLKFQKRVRVAFYVIKIFQYESLYREMEQDSLFEPFIVVIPDKLRHLNTPKDETLNIYDSYKKKYQSVFLGYDFVKRKPIDFTDRSDIIFFTIPYAAMHYPQHFIWHALDKRVLTCFQNYGYFTIRWGRTHIASTPFYNCCWRVWADSVESYRDLQIHQPLHAQNAIITGYCKMDDLSMQPDNGLKKRKTVLIASHHTVWDFKGVYLSNFLRYADFFLELPKRYPQLDFIFRPHPLLFYNLVYGRQIWTEQQRDEYLVKLTSYPNVVFDDKMSFFESFSRSDACIHDCGSFTAEYLYTEKPCCYMLRDEAELEEQFLPVGRKCLDVYYKAFNERDVEDFVQSVVVQGEDPLQGDRKTIAQEIKVNYPNVGKYILDHLKKELCS